MELARIEAQNGRCLEHQRACSLVGAEPRRRDRRPLAAVERTRHAYAGVVRCPLVPESKYAQLVLAAGGNKRDGGEIEQWRSLEWSLRVSGEYFFTVLGICTSRFVILKVQLGDCLHFPWYLSPGSFTLTSGRCRTL